MIKNFSKYFMIGLSFLMVVFCGCGKSEGFEPPKQETMMEQNHAEEVKYIQPKDGISVSMDEIKNVIEECTNVTLAKDFKVGIIPEKARLYDYVRYDDMRKDPYFEDYKTQFEEIFRYFFPGRELRKDSLYYGGFGSGDLDDNGVRNYLLLEGHEEEIKRAQENAGVPGHVWLIYDENMKGQMREWKDSVCLKLGVVFGYGYGELDRGNLLKKIGKNSETGTYPMLHSYEPEELFPVVGVYAPDSEKAFSLKSESVKICDAVSYFEQYINQIPYPEDANEKTRVVEVRLLQVSDTEYAYEFFLTAEYEGLLQDYGWDMVSSDVGRMSRRHGCALMLKEKEVEWLDSFFRKSDIREQSEIDRIITPESAVLIISQELSGNVTFQVRKLELLYFMEYIPNEKGYVDVENGSPHRVWPRWKLTLHNPYDKTDYICYVDAKDGKNFWYYKQYYNE